MKKNSDDAIKALNFCNKFDGISKKLFDLFIEATKGDFPNRNDVENILKSYHTYVECLERKPIISQEFSRLVKESQAKVSRHFKLLKEVVPDLIDLEL